MIRRNLYVADFETTTVEPVTVWLWALSEVGNEEEVTTGKDMESFIETCKNLKNPTIYFHNMKFDAMAIVDYLLKHGFVSVDRVPKECTNTIYSVIDDMGKFYSIDVIFSKTKSKHIKKFTLLDSYKLIPLPVEKMPKAFGLDIEKLDIDYTAHNTENEVTQQEIKYITNDVKIPNMSLQHMFDMKLNKMTIGASALHDYKKSLGGNMNFRDKFPLLDLDVDNDIREAYRGGFCWVNPVYKNRDLTRFNGFDYNSLYPSIMMSKKLPYGEPIRFEGKYNTARHRSRFPLYVQNLTCTFKLKPNKIPTIQLKNSFQFGKNIYLENSGDEYIDLTLTNLDLELFFEHYDVTVYSYNGGYMFRASNNMFKKWVQKWAKIKENATEVKNEALRQVAKLTMNSISGKFGTNPKVVNKKPVLNDDIVTLQTIRHKLTDETGAPVINDCGMMSSVDFSYKEPVYIPVAVFITSWGRYITITTAQRIQDESIAATGESAYIYSDTDSIYINGDWVPEWLELDDSKLCHWKHETKAIKGRFLQCKRYILTTEGGEVKVTCAGLPKTAAKFVTYGNFKVGSKFNGKLVPKVVPGGIKLVEREFTLKD